MNKMKNKYITESKQKITKETKTEDDYEIVDIILEDIKKYLFHKVNEYITTQYIVGIN